MINRDILNDRIAQTMKPKEFVRQFDAARRGEVVYLSKFIRPWHGRPNAKEWSSLRRAVFVRDNFTCIYCGERGKRLECDHVIPVSRGGRNEMDNLATACRPCNRNKRDKMLEEWKR